MHTPFLLHPLDLLMQLVLQSAVSFKFRPSLLKRRSVACKAALHNSEVDTQPRHCIDGRYLRLRLCLCPGTSN